MLPVVLPSSCGPCRTRSDSWLVVHWVLLAVPVPPPELAVLPPVPPAPLPPVAAVLAELLAVAAGALLPDALVVPVPPDEHPARAAAAIAAEAETPETNLILFTW